MKTFITNKTRTIFIDIADKKLLFSEPKNLIAYKIVENDELFKGCKILLNKIAIQNNKKEHLKIKIDELYSKKNILEKEMSKNSDNVIDKVLSRYKIKTNKIPMSELVNLFYEYKENNLKAKCLETAGADQISDVGGLIYYEYDGSKTYSIKSYKEYEKKFYPILHKEENKLSKLNKQLEKYGYKIIVFTYPDINEDPEIILDYQFVKIDDTSWDYYEDISYAVYKKIKKILTKKRA